MAVFDAMAEIEKLRTQLADAQKQLAALDANESHVGYSIANNCWFVRFYGFRTEEEARTALALLTKPRQVPACPMAPAPCNCNGECLK